ncbi:Methionine ABC transporter permease protein [Alkalibacterium sp. AK22]|uniref:methionine ABC transporter permease n=1 Tax=Alkalibacterium sp. AK22 TaxID=1229520 RepID=UPI000447D490|nr:Methionine ABC transporter permease protein [Alkalibacterium sp. AK22]
MIRQILATGILSEYTGFEDVRWDRVWNATTETLYMTGVSVAIVFVLGLILGLLLYETRQHQTIWSVALYKTVSVLVNVFRSIPFIILIVLLIPFTTAIVDSMTGPTAGLPALVFSASPFYARMVETALRDLDKGVIEAAKSMGASKLELIWKVYIPETLPSIVAGITVTTISIVGFTAMAGVIGAGGLGNLAYLEGFQRGRANVTLVATAVILLIVFVIQFIGDRLVAYIDKR